MKKILKNEGFRSILSSLICIAVGLLVGFVVLLIINPSGAVDGILAIIKDYFNYSNPAKSLKYFGNTITKTAPLIMCSLSILFAYKTGLFNIGAAGQYCVGICACLYCALRLGLPWYVCLLAAIVAGAVVAAISGVLKAYCNVNEVISCIMLNWIGLYGTNMLLTTVKESTSPYTVSLAKTNASAVLPDLGLSELFGGNKYVTIALPLTIIIAIAIWVILEKTKFGYELRACGFNREAAKYAGMNGQKNIILTMVIAGALAGAGAGFFYLTGFEQWQCTASTVPGMGFNGIAAAFLGGLNPIGCIFSSYFIQHITSGGAYVDKSMYCAQISDLISSIIIYLCGFVGFLKLVMAKRAAKGEKVRDTRFAPEEKLTEKAGANKEGGEKA